MPAKPRYRSQRTRYEIDHCEPQSRAIQTGKIDFHALTNGHYPGTLLPPKVLPRLSSLGFWNAGRAQDWGLDAHRNEGVEIMFLETGAMDFAVDQKKFKLHAGHFTITRPWQLHKLGAPNIGPGRLHWLILDVAVRRPHQNWRWPKWMVLTPDDLAELTQKLRRNEHPVWRATPAIARSFRELARGVVDWGRPHSESRLAANLNQLLIGILDALGVQQSHEDKQLTSHLHTVGIFLRDLETGRSHPGEPWTLNKMSAHCGMGVTAFSKYCRELVNASPMEYLNQCRLDQAAGELRRNPQRAVTDIAFQFGFNSSQYFATTFRKRHRLTPTEFQKQSHQHNPVKPSDNG